MIKFVRIFLFLFLISFSLLTVNVYSQENSGENYRFKTIIFMPDTAEWTERYPEEFIKRVYFPATIDALKEAQVYYSNQLDGRTFDIDEQPEIVYYTPQENGKFPNLDYFFMETGMDKLLPQNDRVLYVAWFIGSGDTTPTGGDKNWNYGDKFIIPFNHAFLNHEDLGFLTRSPETVEEAGENYSLRQRTIRTVAHEVGHGLTLLHPCSYADADASCPFSIPPPLPPSEESFDSIMGWCMSLTDCRFNNSEINNELYRLCINPFIIPYIDVTECPTPTPIQPLSQDLDFEMQRIIKDPEIPVEDINAVITTDIQTDAPETDLTAVTDTEVEQEL